MKRKLLHAVLVASMAVALSGCGNTSGINADAEETQKATETENIEEERGTEVVAAEVIVIPRSCSWAIQSIVAAPSCTSSRRRRCWAA